MSLSIGEILTYNHGPTGEILLNYLTFSFTLLFTMTVACFVPVNPQTKILEKTIFIPVFLCFFAIQIGFYYALKILGISLVWSGFLGFNTRQFCFYYSWIKSQYIIMYIHTFSIILAAISYIYTAVATNTTSVLYMMIVTYVFGLLVSFISYKHVSRQADITTAIMNYQLQSQIDQLELVCREQERSLTLEKNLRKHFESLNRAHNIRLVDTGGSKFGGEEKEETKNSSAPPDCNTFHNPITMSNSKAVDTEDKIEEILSKMEDQALNS